MTGQRRALGLVLAAVLVPLLVATACGGDEDYDGQVVLAVALPITGDQADFGQTIAEGVQLAADRRNDEGGLLGSKIVVEIHDDAGSVEGATAAAQDIAASGAEAVVGHFNSSASIAAAPIYADAGVLQISPTSTNPRLTDLGVDTVFRVAPTDAAQGPALADLVAGDGHERAAILYEEGNTYTEGLAETSGRALADRGIEVVAVQGYPEALRDWSAPLERIAGSAPEALVLVADMPQAAEILLQAGELAQRGAFPSVAVYGGDSLAKLEFVLRAGSAAEGATVTALLPDLVSGESADADLVSEYREAFGRNPGLDTPAGVAAAETWFRAVEEAGSTSADTVAAVLKNGFGWESPIGEISFDDAGDLRRQVLHATVVRDGAFVSR